MLIGWVVEDDTEKSLQCLNLGNRSSQVFHYPLLRINNGIWESVISGIDTNDIVLRHDNCDKINMINFLQLNSITTSQLKDSAVTEDKIDDQAITTRKIENFAVTTDKIDVQAVTPDLLDRDYLEKTYISIIEGYNSLFSSIKALKDAGSLISPVEPLQGTIYLIGELKLDLPFGYSNPQDVDNYIGVPYGTICNFGRCMSWRDNNIIYIISYEKGWIFSIELVTDTINESEKKWYYSSDDGQHFKFNFKQLFAPMIGSKAITRDKINFEAIGTEQIAQNAITKEKIKNGEITKEKLANNYLDYEHVESGISTTKELKEKILGEKLFRFFINPDSELAQSGFSDGNYIAIPRGSSGSSTSHALINLNDFTMWYLESGSGIPKTLTNSWKKNYWNGCYTLTDICNQVSPADSNYPQLSILYVASGLSGVQSGHYFAYSVTTGTGIKVVLMGGDKLQNYIIYKVLNEDNETFSYTLSKINEVEQKSTDEFTITASLIESQWENIRNTIIEQPIGYEAILKCYGVSTKYTGIFHMIPDNTSDQAEVFIKKIGNNIIKTSSYVSSGPEPDYKETLINLSDGWGQQPKALFAI